MSAKKTFVGKSGLGGGKGVLLGEGLGSARLSESRWEAIACFGVAALPYFLYAGVAGQSWGVYLWGVIVPFFATRTAEPLSPIQVRGLFRLSAAFFFLWAVYPTGSLLALIKHADSLVPGRAVVTSHFSSSFLVSSLVLAVLAWRETAKGLAKKHPDTRRHNSDQRSFDALNEQRSREITS